MPELKLVLLDGDSKGQEYEVPDVLSIGRHKENDLVLADPMVSRRHARIMRRGQGLFLEDLSSAHGTCVNGDRISSRELQVGDIINIGPLTLMLRGEATKEYQDQNADVLIVEHTQPGSRYSSSISKSKLNPEDHAARLAALLSVGLSFQGERDVGKLFSEIAKKLLQVLAIDRCGIFLRNRKEPECVFSRSGMEDVSALPFSKTLLSRALDNGEALVTADAGRDRRLQGASLTGGTLRSAMVAPLWGQERVLGAVAVENRGKVNAFNSEDLNLLTFFASLAGTAIENATLITEVRQETEERAALARFLSPTVADQIRSQGLGKKFTVERREVTVLFTDIRGFTTLSETLPPEELLEALNCAFTCKTEAIFAQNGTIDKFTGDGVLALFGAPIDQPDHARRAVLAAQEILKRCDGLVTATGNPLPVGIGIATGPATVGPVGSNQRLEYTAIGDVVNVAARLVGKAAAGEILMTEETVQAAAAMDKVELAGEWQLKGKSDNVKVFRLRD